MPVAVYRNMRTESRNYQFSQVRRHGSFPKFSFVNNLEREGQEYAKLEILKKN